MGEKSRIFFTIFRPRFSFCPHSCCHLSFPSSVVGFPFLFFRSIFPSPAAKVSHHTRKEGQAHRQGSNMVSGTLGILAKNRGAVLVAAVANTASLLFGYDTGVAGSVVSLQRCTSLRRLSLIAKRRSFLLTKGRTALHPNLITQRILLRRLMSLLISLHC